MSFSPTDIEKYGKPLEVGGYLSIFIGEDYHPYANKQHLLLHRVVMENHIGRYLSPEEVVHHINENKSDNRIENLFLCSGAEHAAIHNRIKRYSLKEKGRISKGVSKARVGNF
jgi:hypothetical protein